MRLVRDEMIGGVGEGLAREATLREDLLDLMPDTITVEPWVSRDVHNQDTYGTTPVTYSVYIQGKTRAVRSVKGEEVVSTVAIHGTSGLSTDDRVTLPARFVPRQPPIINIDRFVDQDGARVEVVYL